MKYLKMQLSNFMMMKISKKNKNNLKFFYLDKFYKRETGISLLEKYGFLKILKK